MNDGSSDGTREALRPYESRPGSASTRPVNLGKVLQCASALQHGRRRHRDDPRRGPGTGPRDYYQLIEPIIAGPKPTL